MPAPAVVGALGHTAARRVARALGSSPRRGCCATASLGSCGCLLLATGLLALLTTLTITSVGPSQQLQPPMRCAGMYASQGFGVTPWEHPHFGVDIVCPLGTPIVAVVAGVFHTYTGSGLCLFPVGRTGGFGLYAEVISGSTAFLYGHLSDVVAAEGATVTAGALIGHEGGTGCATGPHLHLQVSIGGHAVNPCPFLPSGYPSAHDAANTRCWGGSPP